ncbi:hypothetical protein PV783_34025 [Chitinophaga sp. CC14]|uniref:hypothetical protein n=1 Tax=Chitinophaga sp. CC14 TaxID=3029199 RepID=UPI003B80FB73
MTHIDMPEESQMTVRIGDFMVHISSFNVVKIKVSSIDTDLPNEPQTELTQICCGWTKEQQPHVTITNADGSELVK